VGGGVALEVDSCTRRLRTKTSFALQLLRVPLLFGRSHHSHTSPERLRSRRLLQIAVARSTRPRFEVEPPRSLLTSVAAAAIQFGSEQCGRGNRTVAVTLSRNDVVGMGRARARTCTRTCATSHRALNKIISNYADRVRAPFSQTP
jgi:hypothetical protein